MLTYVLLTTPCILRIVPELRATRVRSLATLTPQLRFERNDLRGLLRNALARGDNGIHSSLFGIIEFGIDKEKAAPGRSGA